MIFNRVSCGARRILYTRSARRPTFQPSTTPQVEEKEEEEEDEGGASQRRRRDEKVPQIRDGETAPRLLLELMEQVGHRRAHGFIFSRLSVT